MSALVLVVGALMLAAGGYEMVAGNGDILSERGWSAFIAGSVLVAGGVMTLALGLTVRAVDRLRGAIASHQPVLGAVIAPAKRHEPAPAPAAPLQAVAAPMDLFHEPVFEPEPTDRALASNERAVAHDLSPEPVAAPPPQAEPVPHHEMSEPAGAEPPHVDWLDHSFAEFEREMHARPDSVGAAAPNHAEPVAAVAEPAPPAAAEVPAEPIREALPASLAHDEPAAGRIAHEPAAPPEPETFDAEPEPADHPTVSAREAPSDSAVIGRYESEGTSYVMYADGSIDAQSAAGVYRFASMAELKAFIES